MYFLNKSQETLILKLKQHEKMVRTYKDWQEAWRSWSDQAALHDTPHQVCAEAVGWLAQELPAAACWPELIGQMAV